MRALTYRLLRFAALAVFALWLAWTALTLLYCNLQPVELRAGLAGAYALGLMILAACLRPPSRRLPVLAAIGALLTLVYIVQRPNNERDWAPDVAVAATAEVRGDRAVIHGVRNFHYRSETDFDERWETREYDLSQLRTLDLFMSYWGPVDYCHTLLSFGFEDGQQLAVSVEVRNERGEGFSTYGGLFKMFELSYIFADERDVIGLRTLHRGEQVYLYRLRGQRHAIRELLEAYLDFADKLADEPQFYDVIDNSCGVNILHRIHDIGDVAAVPWSWSEALLNGYWDQLLYERGAIHQGLPFDQLRARSRIDDAAREVGDTPEFSAGIRAELPPAPEPGSSQG